LFIDSLIKTKVGHTVKDVKNKYNNSIDSKTSNIAKDLMNKWKRIAEIQGWQGNYYLMYVFLSKNYIKHSNLIVKSVNPNDNNNDSTTKPSRAIKPVQQNMEVNKKLNIKIYKDVKSFPKRNESGEFVFEDHPEFRPNLSPQEVLKLGYYNKYYYYFHYNNHSHCYKGLLAGHILDPLNHRLLIFYIIVMTF